MLTITVSKDQHQRALLSACESTSKFFQNVSFFLFAIFFHLCSLQCNSQVDVVISLFITRPVLGFFFSLSFLFWFQPNVVFVNAILNQGLLFFFLLGPSPVFFSHSFTTWLFAFLFVWICKRLSCLHLHYEISCLFCFLQWVMSLCSTSFFIPTCKHTISSLVLVFISCLFIFSWAWNLYNLSFLSLIRRAHPRIFSFP